MTDRDKKNLFDDVENEFRELFGSYSSIFSKQFRHIRDKVTDPTVREFVREIRGELLELDKNVNDFAKNTSELTSRVMSDFRDKFGTKR